MTVTPILDHDRDLPEAQGHAIGFASSQIECDAIIQELNDAGFATSTIQVFSGEDGIQLLKRMMSGSLWGEAEEDMLKQCVIELSHGHFALSVESRDREQALAIANLAAKHGGHAFTHFGVLTDERLTR
jgi:hypothetical protein